LNRELSNSGIIQVPDHHHSLLPHHLDHSPFAAAAVELGVENLLPRAPKVQFAVRDRDDDLMVGQDALEVGVTV